MPALMFSIDGNCSRRRYKSRLLIESSLLLLSALGLYISRSTEHIIFFAAPLVVCVALITIDVLFRSRAERVAEDTTLLVGDRAMVLSTDGGACQLEYKDIGLKAVKLRNGCVFSIRLSVKYQQDIVLRCFTDMDLLLEELKKRLGRH